jgi:hypothetical protein
MLDAKLKNIMSLAPTEFGNTAIYKSRGSRKEIRGIFDEPYQGVNIAEVEFASATPIFTLPTKSLACKPSIGDVLLLKGDTYTVRNFRSDGTGMTVLQLELATNLEIATENNLLLETGNNLLLETGKFILLEVGNP